MRTLKLPAILAALSVLSAPVLADDTGATIASQGNGEGATACASCHGSNGEGNAAAGFPRLAGLPGDYLAGELRAYASGSREHAVMKPMASALSDSEIEAVANYYSEQQVPASAADASGIEGDARGQRLVRHGDWTKGLPACVSCHGPEARGVGQAFPPIAGQPEAYISNQLKAWQSGKRHDDPNALMASVTEHMSDADIEAVAGYLASIPAAPAGGQ